MATAVNPISAVSVIPPTDTTPHVNKFVSVLKAVGKLFNKGITFADQYAIPLVKLVGVIFPQAAPEAAGVVTAMSLIQKSVFLIEQKYAASNVQNGTGAQKLEEVSGLVGPAVMLLLKQEGIKADDDYVKNIITSVVGVLNAQSGSHVTA